MSDKPASASADPAAHVSSKKVRAENARAFAVIKAVPGTSQTATDRESFGRFIVKHQEKITGLVYRLLSWRGEVEDVVQDVFVDAIKNYAKFRGEASLETWLTRIAINRCRSYQRKQWLRRHLSLTWGENEVPLEPSEITQRPSGRLETQESIFQVQTAIRQLNQRDRELIVLRYMEEVSINGIANLLKLAPGTVNVRLNRARSRLEKLIRPSLERS